VGKKYINSQMPRHLISDAHEWINKIPTVLTRVRWKTTANWTIYQFNLEMDPPEGYLKKE